MGMKGMMICASQLWGSAMHVSTEHSICSTQRFIVVLIFSTFSFSPAIFYLHRGENLFLATRWRKQAFYSIWIKQEAKSSWPKYYRHLRERWFFFPSSSLELHKALTGDLETCLGNFWAVHNEMFEFWVWFCLEALDFTQEEVHNSAFQHLLILCALISFFKHFILGWNIVD